MKILKIATAVVVVICSIMVLVISIQPRQARLERQIVIAAPDSIIFPYLSNYKILSSWWPWPKMDAELKQRFEGVDGTVGAKVIWNGSNAGEGSMVLDEVCPHKHVRSLMRIAGQKQIATNEFQLEPVAQGTRVIWKYNGVNDGIIGKAKWVVMGTLLNSQYDLGLKNLKRIIEETRNAKRD